MQGKEPNQHLPIKSIDEAIEEAKALIQEERSGIVTGLYTRFEGINRAKMKYWRFRSVTAIAGMSGSGKSAFLNMLEDDFTNPKLNPHMLKHVDKDPSSPTYGKMVGENKIILIAFKYEMDAADEILRNLSGKVGKSYANLLSSETIKTENNSQISSATYNKVSDEETVIYFQELDKLKGRPIVYIENAGNLDQLYNTVLKVHEDHPGKRIIVTLDHTLLSLKLSEKDDLELMSRTAKIAIRLKKLLNVMVIFLGQLNGEIEKLPRRENADFHFPVKTDIHAQNQIFWACDDVIVVHRPEILGIQKYGKLPFPMRTKSLIHLGWIKSRKNKIGNLWFEEVFREGKIVQVEPNFFKYGNDIMQL